MRLRLSTLVLLVLAALLIGSAPVAAATRVISGTVYRPNGPAYAGAVLTVRLFASFSNANQTVVPQTWRATANAAGFVTVSILVPDVGSATYGFSLPGVAETEATLGAGATVALETIFTSVITEPSASTVLSTLVSTVGDPRFVNVAGDTMTGALTGTSVTASTALTMPSSTTALLPAAGVPGRIHRVTDGIRGLWSDTGTQWVSLTGQMVNVKDFGAKGNDNGVGGGQDDTASIQNAIDTLAASIGGDVLLPDGHYRVTSRLILRQGVRLRGNGALSTVINNYGNDHAIFAEYPTADYVNIADLQIYDTLGAAARTFGDAIHLDGSAYAIRFDINNVYIVSHVNGIYFKRAGYSSIWNSRIVLSELDGIRSDTASSTHVIIGSSGTSSPGRHSIYFSQTSMSQILGFYADDSGSHGILIEDSPGVTLYGVSSEQSAGDGLRVVSSDNVVATSFRASKITTQNGIVVLGSYNATFLSPLVSTITGYCIVTGDATTGLSVGRHTYNVLLVNPMYSSCAAGYSNDVAGALASQTAESINVVGSASFGGVRLSKVPTVLATIADNPVSSTATTINTNGGTSGYPETHGTLLIDSEVMTYTGKTSSSFVEVMRGAYGTTATSHALGATVNTYTILAAAGATTPRFVQTGAGNVGIGMFAPQYTLDVAGGIRATSLLLSALNATAPAGIACDSEAETGAVHWDSVNDNLFMCSGSSGWRKIVTVAP